jgi:hypothetical protein
MSRPGSATSSPMRPASSGASIQFASRMSGKPQSSRRHRAGPPSDDLSGTRDLGREVDRRAVGVTSGPGLWRRPCECGQEPQPQGDQRLLRGTGISGLGRLLRWTHALRYEKHSREGWARTQRHAPGSCVQVSSRWCMEGARSALQTRSSSPGSQHTTGTGGLGGEEDRRDGWASPVGADRWGPRAIPSRDGLGARGLVRQDPSCATPSFVGPRLRVHPRERRRSSRVRWGHRSTITRQRRPQIPCQGPWATALRQEPAAWASRSARTNAGSKPIASANCG